MPILTLALLLATVMAVLFIVLLMLVLPLRITVPLDRVAAAIDRLAMAMGLLEACPTCGVPAEELGWQGDRQWLHCPACGRNPWLAGHPEQQAAHVRR